MTPPSDESSEDRPLSDNEPPLEDEPHLDTGAAVPHSSPAVRRRVDQGNGTRSERRSQRTAARRRKFRARIGLVLVPTVVVVALVVVLLVVFGGADREGAVTATTSVVAERTERGALLVVDQGGAAADLVLIQSRSPGGIVLAVPGFTLLKAGDSWQLVSALAKTGQADLLVSALGEAFGGQVGSIATVSWTDLRAAMEDAEIEELPPAVLSADIGEAPQLAAAVLDLARAGDSQSGERWEKLPLTGDWSEFRSAVSALAAASGDWISTAVTGTVVRTDGSTYLNPRVDVVRALLTSGSAPLPVTVQVKNGSGALGIAEQAVAQLEALGYEVSAAGNSDDFPGVEQTRIEVSPGESETGARVRAMLGVGAVIENESLDPGQVVVVLGKDYAPSSGPSVSAVIGSSGT